MFMMISHPSWSTMITAQRTKSQENRFNIFKVTVSTPTFTGLCPTLCLPAQYREPSKLVILRTKSFFNQVKNLPLEGPMILRVGVFFKPMETPSIPEFLTFQGRHGEEVCQRNGGIYMKDEI